MLVKTSYLSLFFLGEKMQKISWNLSYHITVKPQKPKYAKMVYKTTQNIWTVVSQKERQLQGSNLWPSNLQFCTLTSQPWRQLDRKCFFHRHYLPYVLKAYWQQGGDVCTPRTPCPKELLYESAFSQVLSTWVYLISILLFFSKECTPVSR